MPGFLDKERSVATLGYDRRNVPPAALAVHLCIGMAYGFSVFWLPLSKALGITAPVVCPPDAGFLEIVNSASCDWKISWLGWTYTLFFVFLGSSAALWGKWLEDAGPRKAGFLAAILWGGGFFVSAAGIYYHKLWLLWLGSGVIGGIGLGLGYISPVSTLIKWFPDRRGMATGLAIMGFGGGAIVGAPLAGALIEYYATPSSVGVWETFVTLGFVYFVAMSLGAFGYRLPNPGFSAASGSGEPDSRSFLYVPASEAWKTDRFWLIWLCLCFNVTAGIGIIGMASPMVQEIFGGKLLGGSYSLAEAASQQKAEIASVAAGFTALLSVFNIAGRFFWASLSDYLGRKTTYAIFFALGFFLYAYAPSAVSGGFALFAAVLCLILSMYGGGFATLPAYLADIFGTKEVGAIHGKLLTAWSVAGIIGPAAVNYIREYALDLGIGATKAYGATLYALSAFLALGFLCNALVKPLGRENFFTAVGMEEKKPETQALNGTASKISFILPISWIAVLTPVAYGAYNTCSKVLSSFSSL